MNGGRMLQINRRPHQGWCGCPLVGSFFLGLFAMWMVLDVLFVPTCIL
jgi:hypothetical protein